MMRYPEFHKTTHGAFAKLLEVGPVQVGAHVAIVASGDRALGLDNGFYIFSEAVVLSAYILGKIVRNTGIQSNHERYGHEKKGNDKFPH
jgi:hypothetical protein